MAEYKVFWVRDFVITDSENMLEIPNATKVINDWCNAGYELVSIVPGTNAQTYMGLFITLRRPDQ
ncbi:hypothetical protein [Arthrobacter sp. EpRS71]|uniref:hypothetical protein n=1 Tax=Arthrobacter sp. EpRS71 TaxID=1743141 RepID=UPI000748E198|nr:hypothetical protein [Arthrobacter sp. EpRS71]KUM38995.1 hypothetical protein AR689_07525 [Arthrobacter sp. EpRS71]